ncbi:competence protein F [Methylophaga frappieri]|uniref:Competence protein F n=1 Tax=Methylophaga frappieri (strain ATCC BAA-2434 / DSM 25690 / JAM7) TaxID=754477 RepID=I1YHS5_METFJ|nr:ComF family protein [Methylophaga frappieri]AFJ02468.1 competence protein F [Methylophaga frappieri]
MTDDGSRFCDSLGHGLFQLNGLTGMAKDFIATTAHRLRRLYNIWMPNPCFLCHAPAGAQIICNDCLADLPHTSTACLRCAAPLPNNGVCGACQQSPPPQDTTLAALYYIWPADKLVTAYKFRSQLALQPLFAQLLFEKVRRSGHDLPHLILPIPLHTSRLRYRGYNQATDISQRLGRLLNRPVANHLLQRVRATQPQSNLAFSQRRRNLRNAFQCQPLTAAQQQHVVLIDDVYTTGHTVSEAARCLRKAGVKRLDVWTIARAIRHD